MRQRGMQLLGVVLVLSCTQNADKYPTTQHDHHLLPRLPKSVKQPVITRDTEYKLRNVEEIYHTTYLVHLGH